MPTTLRPGLYALHCPVPDVLLVDKRRKERQAAEKRPLPPVIEPEPWRPDPKWGMNTGPPATDASHAFRSSKNRPASLKVGKPPPRGAPPPSPVRRLKVVDPVEERAASPLSRPLTARDDFPTETEDERNQRIESELAAQPGQLVGALQREEAEAEAPSRLSTRLLTAVRAEPSAATSSVRCTALHLRPSHSGVVSLDAGHPTLASSRGRQPR